MTGFPNKGQRYPGTNEREDHGVVVSEGPQSIAVHEIKYSDIDDSFTHVEVYIQASERNASVGGSWVYHQLWSNKHPVLAQEGATTTVFEVADADLTVATEDVGGAVRTTLSSAVADGVQIWWQWTVRWYKVTPPLGFSLVELPGGLFPPGEIGLT